MNGAFLAQSVERTTLNRVVVGSIPTEGAPLFFVFALFEVWYKKEMARKYSTIFVPTLILFTIIGSTSHYFAAIHPSQCMLQRELL